MRRILLLAILPALWLPPAAFAGSASISVTTVPSASPIVVMRYTAAPGERNQIAVSREFAIDMNTITLHDAGAVVTAGPGCTALDARTVRCEAERVAIGAFTSQPVPMLTVDAGDGDDAVAVPLEPSGAGSSVYGGEGADVLTGAGVLSGGPGNDVLTGGDSGGPSKGSDYLGETLIGGAGNDVLRGGGGLDVLIGDGGAPGMPDPGGGNDLIDGGEGRDSVPYATRTTAVRVDLAAGTADGAGGERDRVTGVEDVVGGAGADVLLGDDGRNALRGGPGDDTLEGRGDKDYLVDDVDGPTNGADDRGADTLRGGGGDDKLFARGGRDRLSGGAGDDLLESATAGRRLTALTVRCGSGSDRVRGEPRGQLLTGCEIVDFADANPGSTTMSVLPQRRPGGRLRFAATCSAESAVIACKIRLSLRVGSSALSRRSVSIPNPGRRNLDVRPKRAAARGTVLRVALTGGLDYGARGKSTWKPIWRVRL